MESTEQRQIRPEDWLEVLRCEYLRGFLPAGGAAVKCVVTADRDDRDAAVEGLRGSARGEGCLLAELSAETTKLHLIDRLFFGLAAQAPWGELAASYVRGLLAQAQYRLPIEGEPLTLAGLASLNERDESRLGHEVRSLLERSLLGDYRMCQEFRYAMMELCLQALGEGSVQGGVVEQWLRGELRLISAMKPCLVFQKIARHNARHLLLSLAHWLRLAGRSGLVLVLDLSRYTVGRRPAEADVGFYYSRAAMIDAYEVIRQLIDGTDDAEGCLFVVLSIPEFLSDERRGLQAYQALQFRLGDEVHDRRRANPLAPLVRLSRTAEPLRPAGEGARHE